MSVEQLYSIISKEKQDMKLKWNKPGIPHSGWTSGEVEDLEEPIGICQMCDKREIRYMHTMHHTEHPDLIVGCVCAENMANDYVNPRIKERALRNRAKRKKQWLKKEWNLSAKGNLYLKAKSHLIVLKQSNYDTAYTFAIDGDFNNCYFPTLQETKLKVFDLLD